MPNTKISALTAPTNAETLLPTVNGWNARFPIAAVINVSNRGPTIQQLSQNYRAVLYSGVVDLKVAATTTLAVPTGFRFYLTEVFVVATSIAALVSQPVLSWGITGNNIKYVNALAMTQLLSSFTRERVELTGTDGETTLNATVDTIANAGTFSGRFGFEGLLLTT